MHLTSEMKYNQFPLLPYARPTGAQKPSFTALVLVCALCSTALTALALFPQDRKLSGMSAEADADGLPNVAG